MESLNMYIDSSNLSFICRCSKKNLEAELNRIETEKKYDMKMFHNEKQRFIAKYNKVEPSGDHETKHTAETVNKITSEHYNHIHSLLFTNGEIDIDKLMVLHLISRHEAEYLTPTIKKNELKGYFREQTPIDRLIERSKRTKFKDKICKVLPAFVLDLPLGEEEETSNMNCCEDDNKENACENVSLCAKRTCSRKFVDLRLSSRLIVNDKILELLKAVLSTLKHSNVDKINKLVDISQDMNSLKMIFRKPHIIEFIRLLKNYTIISSCDSFILTPPFKIKARHIDIKTLSPQLEGLVKHIHSRALQYPIRAEMWKQLYEKEKIGKMSEEEIQNEQYPGAAHETNPRERIKSVTELEKHPESRRQSVTESRRQSLIDEQSKIESRRRSVLEDQQTKARTPNFITRNIEAVHNQKRKDSDTPVPSSSNSRKSSTEPAAHRRASEAVPAIRRRSTVTPITPSTNSPEKIKEINEIIEDLAMKEFNNKITNMDDKIMKQIVPVHNHEVDPDVDDLIFTRHQKPGRRSSTDSDTKFHLKQTTCPACMEKWKIPLPDPKVPTPNLRKVADNGVPKANFTTMQRVSNLIDREKFKQDSYDRKYSTDNTISKRESNTRKVAQILPSYTGGTEDLDPYHLEKIKQEIRSKETQKKLKNFLADK